MKVLYITYLNKNLDGANISLFNLLMGLKDKGIIPFVTYSTVCADDTADFIKLLQKSNIECFPIPIVSSAWQNFRILRKNPFYLLKNLKRLWNTIKWIKPSRKINIEKLSGIIQKVKPDIIHTNIGLYHEGYMVAKKCRIPHIWHLREYQDLDFGYHIYPTKKSFIRKLKISTSVITITDDIKKHFNLSKANNTQTIYNGVLSVSDINYEQNKEKYFLCASRISSEKGILDVILSFADFCKNHNDYKLKIAGSGNENYVNELKNTAKRLNIEDKIEFLGYQPKEIIVQLMTKATALIVASRFEGFGRMTAEAIFCGCLVIGNNTGGTKEILEQTGGGVLYSGLTALNDAMECITKMSTSEYETTVLEAQKKAVELYSIEQNTEKTYSLYQKIIKKRPDNEQ